MNKHEYSLLNKYGKNRISNFFRQAQERLYRVPKLNGKKRNPYRFFSKVLRPVLLKLDRSKIFTQK